MATATRKKTPGPKRNLKNKLIPPRRPPKRNHSSKVPRPSASAPKVEHVPIYSRLLLLPRELRNFIYHELWKQPSQLTVPFCGINFYVTYTDAQHQGDQETEPSKNNKEKTNVTVPWLLCCRQVLYEGIEQLQRHSTWSFYGYKDIPTLEMHTISKPLLSPFQGRKLQMMVKEGDGRVTGIIMDEIMTNKKTGTCLELKMPVQRNLHALGQALPAINKLRAMELRILISLRRNYPGSVPIINLSPLEKLGMTANLEEFRLRLSVRQLTARDLRWRDETSTLQWLKDRFEDQMSLMGKRMLGGEGIERSELVGDANQLSVWDYEIKKI